MRLLVDDFPRALSFYRDVVGFEVIVDAATIGYAEFASGDAVLAIYDRSMMARVVGQSAASGSRGAIVTFDSIDVDAEYERLVAAGARGVAAPHDQPTWGFRIALVADPEGNLLEINRPLEVEPIPRKA